MKVAVVENVLKLNDEIAQLNRAELKKAGVFTLDIIGAPGCGKTTLIESTLQALGNQLRIAVIAGDLATQRDADRIAQYCNQVVQVNTGKGCHLDANQVRQAMGQLDLSALDLLFIENVGNLICPVGFDLGQDIKVGIFSVSEGDDKPAKHPYLVYASSLIILNKTDLLPHVPFKMEQFQQDIQKLNPNVRLLKLSPYKNDNMDEWTNWLQEKVCNHASVNE